MTTAATRDDVASVTHGLLCAAARQDSEAARYAAMPEAFDTAAAFARGMAAAYRVSADMLTKYVRVEP